MPYYSLIILQYSLHENKTNLNEIKHLRRFLPLLFYYSLNKYIYTPNLFWYLYILTCMRTDVFACSCSPLLIVLLNPKNQEYQVIPIISFTFVLFFFEYCLIMLFCNTHFYIQFYLHLLKKQPEQGNTQLLQLTFLKTEQYK